MSFDSATESQKGLIVAQIAAIGSATALLQKSAKTPLTDDERKQLTSSILLLSSIKDETGESVVANTIRHTTNEILSDKPTTLNAVASIIADDIREELKHSGGRRRYRGGVGRRGSTSAAALPAEAVAEAPVAAPLPADAAAATAAATTVLGFSLYSIVRALTTGYLALNTASDVGVAVKARGIFIAKKDTLDELSTKYCTEEARKYIPDTTPLLSDWLNDQKLIQNRAECYKLETGARAEVITAQKEWQNALVSTGIKTIASVSAGLLPSAVATQITPLFAALSLPVTAENIGRVRQAANTLIAAQASPTPAASTGGRKRRNTKKRVMKKRRVTRRKMLTSSY
jgi:hypothetical protein